MTKPNEMGGIGIGIVDDVLGKAAVTVIDGLDAVYLTDDMYQSFDRDQVNTYMHRVVREAYDAAFAEKESRRVQQIVELMQRRDDFLQDLQRIDKVVHHTPDHVVSYADDYVAMDAFQYKEYITAVYIPAVAEFLRATAAAVEEYGGDVQEEDDAVRTVTVAAGRRLTNGGDDQAGYRAVSTFFNATFDVLTGLTEVLPVVAEDGIPGCNNVLEEADNRLPEPETIREAEKCVDQYVTELFRDVS